MLKKYEDFSKGEEQRVYYEKTMLGKLFLIYPTRSKIELIVIAKCLEVFHYGDSNWGQFDGYILNPEERKGEHWRSQEYLHDYVNSIPTPEEIKEYEYYNAIDNYNL